MRNGHAWGEMATLHPDQNDALAALRDAALDPWTWVPLAGVAVLSIDDLDEGLSDWALEHTPLYDSPRDAGRAADDLREAARHTWWVSIAATPSGDELGPWARNKFQGWAVEWAAVESTHAVSLGVKDWIDRERPNGADQRSFWSSHAATATAYSSLAWHNFDAVDMHDAARIPLRAGLIALAGTTTWARIESGENYPTDVLTGVAVGNFIARFVHDAFLGRSPGVVWSAFGDPSTGEFAVGASWSH